MDELLFWIPSTTMDRSVVVGDPEGVMVIPAQLADEAVEMTAFEDLVAEEAINGRAILVAQGEGAVSAEELRDALHGGLLQKSEEGNSAKALFGPAVGGPPDAISQRILSRRIVRIMQNVRDHETLR
jgi:hypothetical protein